MKTKFTVLEMLESYKREILDFMQAEYKISFEESVQLIKKTGFERSFLANHRQFDATEPSKIGRRAYEYWMKR